MRWNLILRLSTIGLLLALGSIFFVPVALDTLLWFVAFLFYAYQIGRSCRTLRFLNGFALGIVNSLWITGTHSLFLDRYLRNHPRALATVQMVHAAHLPGSPRLIISATGLGAGIVSGLMIGVFSIIAGMMIEPRRVELAPYPQADAPL